MWTMYMMVLQSVKRKKKIKFPFSNDIDETEKGHVKCEKSEAERFYQMISSRLEYREVKQGTDKTKWKQTCGHRLQSCGCQERGEQREEERR